MNSMKKHTNNKIVFIPHNLDDVCEFCGLSFAHKHEKNTSPKDFITNMAEEATPEATQDEAIYQILIDEFAEDLYQIGHQTRGEIKRILTTMIEEVRIMEVNRFRNLLINEIAEAHKTGVSTSNLTRIFNQITNLK